MKIIMIKNWYHSCFIRIFTIIVIIVLNKQKLSKRFESVCICTYELQSNTGSFNKEKGMRISFWKYLIDEIQKIGS